MASGNGVELAAAYVTIMPSLKGAGKSIEQQLSGISLDGAGRKLGNSLGEGISDGVMNALDGVSSLGDKLTAGLTAPVVAAGAAMVSTAVDFDTAASTIEAAVGSDTEAGQELLNVGKDLWSKGWAQSMDELTPALVDAYEVLGDISEEDMSTVIRGAKTMERVWGADVNESLRGVNILMDSFGLTADEATDLMVAGMQRGLNYTDELGDNLSEYAGRWGDAGISASQYFSLLEAGTENGAYNLDRVGDFLNEFLTSLSDGRMAEGIAFFSEGTQELFQQYQEGGATAEQVLNAVVGELANGKTETEAMTIASQLWSSLGEDNCLTMITALAGVTDSFGDVSGATDQAAGSIEDSIGVRATAAVNDLKEAFEPFMEDAVDLLEKAADAAEDFSNWYTSLDEDTQNFIVNAAAIAAAAGPVLSVGGRLAKGAGTLAKGLGKVAGSAKTTASSAGDVASAASKASGGLASVAKSAAGTAAGAAVAVGAGIELSAAWQAAGRDIEGNAQLFDSATQSLANTGAYALQYGDDVKAMYQNLGEGTIASIEDMQQWAESFRGASSWAFQLFPQNKQNFEDQYRQMFNSIDAETIGGWLAVQASTVAGGEQLSATNADNVQSILDTYSILKEYLPEDSHQALVAMAQAMEGSIPELQGAADMSSEEIIDTMRDVLLNGSTGTAATGTQAGTELGGGFSGGVSSTTGQVDAAGRSLAAASESAKSNNANATWWGQELGQNLASGIQSMIGTVSRAASSLASGIAQFLHFSEPDKGPLVGINDSGAELAENFANGMLKMTPYAAAAANTLAEAMRGPLDSVTSPELGISTNGRGFAAGQSVNASRTYNIYIDGQALSADPSMASAIDQLVAGVRKAKRMGVAA